MAELPDGMRRVEDLRLPRLGCVRRSEGASGSWELHDAGGGAVPEVNGFLRELQAIGASDSTMRSYTHDLLRWWRFLAAVEVPWVQATRTEVRDLVLWMKQAENPQRRRSDYVNLKWPHCDGLFWLQRGLVVVSRVARLCVRR